MNNAASDIREQYSFWQASICQFFLGSLLCLLPVLTCDAAFPSTNLLCLPDGRMLEYAEYGNPSGSLVLYFHGTPGSHLEPFAAVDEISLSGLHVIALNRPGIGKSSYQCDRQIVDWPSDVLNFLSARGYGHEQVGIIGFSGGTPYALACARAFPERITRVAIVSGHTPPDAPCVAEGEADDKIQLFRRRPLLASIAVGITSRRLNRRPDKVVNRFLKNWDAADRALIDCSPRMRSILERSLAYTTLCGTEGIVTDVQLLGGCWGFPINSACEVPISIWHGQCDRIAPLAMGQYLHSQLPGSEMHVDTRSGHVTTFRWHAAEILAEFQ
jgi:pimeloyl-ACP methyl ester carboxylesterase